MLGEETCPLEPYFPEQHLPVSQQVLQYLGCLDQF